LDRGRVLPPGYSLDGNTTNVETVAFVDSTNRGLPTGDKIAYAILGTDANTPTTALSAIETA